MKKFQRYYNKTIDQASSETGQTNNSNPQGEPYLKPKIGVGSGN